MSGAVGIPNNQQQVDNTRTADAAGLNSGANQGNNAGSIKRTVANLARGVIGKAKTLVFQFGFQVAPNSPRLHAAIKRAVSEGDPLKVQKWLGRGANPNVAAEGYNGGSNASSLLSSAIRNGNYEVVRLLLNAGATANGSQGNALHAAVLSGKHELIPLLIGREEVDVNAVQDDLNETPLSIQVGSALSSAPR